MSITSTRISKLAAMLFVLGANVPRALCAQTNAPATQHVEVTLNIPVQAKDFDPKYVKIRLRCYIQPSGAAAGVGAVTNDNASEAAVDHGSFAGTVMAHFTIVLQQPIPSGQQWSYSCHSNLLYLTTNGQLWEDQPGDGLAPLVSGANLVTGTFAMQ